MACDETLYRQYLSGDDAGLEGRWYAMQDAVATAALEAYTCALEAGIAKEQARALLRKGMKGVASILAAVYDRSGLGENFRQGEAG